MTSPREPTEAVHRSTDRREARTLGLVLESAGIPHELRFDQAEFVLVVSAEDATRARAELDAYARENKPDPTRATLFPQRSDGWAAVLAYACVLLFVAILAQRDAFGLDWNDAGRTQASLIRQGQWWRAATALTLHVDAPHLIANMVIGGLFGLFAGQTLGSGLAWAAALLGGALGNLINAYIRRPEHSSVGASTAVFAILGILAAMGWTERRSVRAARLARWTPLIAGIVLLGYLGTGGERTDVTAHVAGFISGVILGWLAARLSSRVASSAKAQFLLGLATLLGIALAWTLALTTPLPERACHYPQMPLAPKVV